MTPFAATAARRAALWACAILATLLGHAATTAHVDLEARAPLMWLALLGLTVPLDGLRRRSRAFKAWGPGRLLAALLATQAVLHLLLHLAPWAFGMHTHGDAPLVTSGALLVHAACALLVLVPLCWGERLLARAVAMVRRLLAAPARRRPLPRAARLVATAAAPAPAPPQGPRTSRGPPRPRLRPGGPQPAHP